MKVGVVCAGAFASMSAQAQYPTKPIQKRFGEQGLEPTVMTPQELKRYTESDVSRWTRLIKAANIKGQ